MHISVNEVIATSIDPDSDDAKFWFDKLSFKDVAGAGDEKKGITADELPRQVVFSGQNTQATSQCTGVTYYCVPHEKVGDDCQTALQDMNSYQWYDATKCPCSSSNSQTSSDTDKNGNNNNNSNDNNCSNSNNNNNSNSNNN